MDIDVALLEIISVICPIVYASFFLFIYFLSRKLGHWKLKLPNGLWDKLNLEVISARESAETAKKGTGDCALCILDDYSHGESISVDLVDDPCFSVTIPTLFAMSNVQATKLNLYGENKMTRQATLMIFDKRESKIEIKISQFRSLSYATRKGLPNILTTIFFVIALSCSWVFLLQLPLSILPVVSSAIGTPGTLLASIVTIEYRMHFAFAVVAFYGLCIGVYITIFELWNCNGSLNIYLAISGSLLTICFIITPKFYIFEWATIYILCSWYQIAWILM